MSTKKKKNLLTLEELDDNLSAPEERLTSPEALIAIHDQRVLNDADSSRNRGAVQELVDFVPPFDPDKMRADGRGEGFNVNYGLTASLRNEALGAFVDVFTSPPKLMGIKLKNTVTSVEKDYWQDVMAEELTSMIRNSDIGLARFLCLADIFTTHGISITFFEDTRNWRFVTTGLDDFKFSKDAEAIASTLDVITCQRELSLDKLWAKIREAPDGAEWHNGWNVPAVKLAIFNAAAGIDAKTNKYRIYEDVVDDIKKNQAFVSELLPTVGLVYGWVREYNGKISIYAALQTPGVQKQKPNVRRQSVTTETNFLYKERFAFENPDGMLQIFPYSVGHKNQIYSIRGLAYFLYEAGQADNVLRNKMMENARMASSHVYAAETVDDSIAWEIMDLGPVVILPPGLVSKDQPAAMNLERNMIPALQANEQILERHSGGLASSTFFKEPRARENKLATSAFLESTSKLNAFAMCLFYNPWDKLLREITRRAFTVTQTERNAKAEVAEMKRRCVERGVPEAMFDEIDINMVTAYRVLGNGSRANRLMIFEATVQMFSSLDPDGQANFVYDFLVEYFGVAQAQRYKKRPETMTAPLDSVIAELENHALLEGGWFEPKPGQNPLVHGAEHCEELEAGLEVVKNGQMGYGDWAQSRLQLYKHAVMTVEQATVHPTQQKELNELRRRVQNIKGIIDNGLKELEAQAQEAQAAQDQQGQQMTPEQSAKMQAHAMEMRFKFERIQADIEGQKRKTQAVIEDERQKSMAQIARDNMLAAAKMEREAAYGT